jgi:SnoaL-like protein
MSFTTKFRYLLALVVVMCVPCALAQDLVPKAPPDAMKLTALDYAEIEQLAVRYAWLLDHCVNGGYDYADLYVADGQFSVADKFGTASNEQRRFVSKGREALAKAAGGDGKGNCVDPKTTLGYGLTHIVTNHLIVPTKDGAVGKHRLVTVGVCGYPHLIELQGGYEDEYVKTKDGWRFKSRIHVFKQSTSLQFGVCANRDASE